jgi:hypothetical protein
MRELMRARPAALVAFACLAFAFAFLVQPKGDNQSANYALTRALADGTADISRPLAEGASSIDVVEFEGHRYAAKAPGLAIVSVPPYLALEAVGVRVTGDPTRPVWALHLWSVVLPAIVLLLLVALLADRVARGLGIPVAVLAGVATLILPFSNLFFVHVLATCLGFAAFALLWLEREGPQRLGLLAAAGLSAGFATTTDYPLGLLALILVAFAVARGPGRLRRALAYGGGLALGVLPALAYNHWLFGSFFHFPYEGWSEPGGAQREGFFGATSPNLITALELLFFPAGLAVLLPALAGLVPMWRRGLRAETATIAAVVLAFFLHNSASVANPFGGASPGPRHLIPIIPFLAVPLAAALRAFPGAVLGPALGGAAVMVVYTATTPLAAWDRHALDRFLDHSFVTNAFSPIGIKSAFGIALFVAAVLVAIGAAVLASGVRRVPGRELLAGGIALAGWTIAVRAAPRLLLDDPQYGRWVLIGWTVAVAALLAALYRSGDVRRAASGLVGRVNLR